MARTARNIGKAPDASMSVAITNTDGARLPHPNQRTKLPMTPRMASAPMDQSMLRHRRTRSGLLSWSRSTCILSSGVGRVLRASHHTPPREQRHHARVTVRTNEGCHRVNEYPCRRKGADHRHTAHHHPLRRRLQPLQRNGAVCDRAGFATRCTASWRAIDTDGSGAPRRAWCPGPSFKSGFLTNHRLHRGSRLRRQNATKKRSAPANRRRYSGPLPRLLRV